MLRVRSTGNCINTPRVLFALEETGVAYETVLAVDGWFTRSYGIPGPQLEDGDLVVVELGAILRHVARGFGAGTLMPADLAGQAQVDRWLDFMHRRLGRALSDQDAVAVRGYLERLDVQLAGRDYLVGAALTIADCTFAALIPVRPGLPLHDLPALAGYLDRLAARTSWSRALARTL